MLFNTYVIISGCFYFYVVISYFFHLLLSSSFICFAIPNAQAVVGVPDELPLRHEFLSTTAYMSTHLFRV
jgi:hypothetical protein